MRLAISNIAWDRSLDEVVAKLLKSKGFDAIDLAPGKYFPDPKSATSEDIARVKEWWGDFGIEITGMQALMFDTKDLNLFGPSNVQDLMLRHLREIMRIGAGLGATRLVFGSPKNRDRSGISDQECIDVAVAFFRRAADIADSYGVQLCLEPNPPCYGANFMINSTETAAVVELIAHRSVRMQLDTGAMTINNEDIVSVLDRFGAAIGHIHASEPGLVPLGDGGADHARVGELLMQRLPNHVVTIEMLPAEAESQISSVTRALDVAIQNYSGPGGRRIQ